MDMESDTVNPHGWYSEASIQNIIYDLWDNDDDNNDTLSLGFGPIHHAFIGAQKTTPAFTSIFSFITILKSENNGNSNAIDNIVSAENIAEITDIYDTNRTNEAGKYPYHDLVGGAASVSTGDADGAKNKLSNRQYVKFSIATSKPYIITVEKSSSSNDTDPDFVLYKTDTFSYVDRGNGTAVNKEEKSISLDAGNYLLDISEYNNVNTATFDVTVQ
jgi:hypothetical protein